MRSLFLGAGISFIVAFGALTLYVMATNGVTVVGMLALLMITMIGLGVIGAIRNPPDQ